MSQFNCQLRNNNNANKRAYHTTIPLLQIAVTNL